MRRNDPKRLVRAMKRAAVAGYVGKIAELTNEEGSITELFMDENRMVYEVKNGVRRPSPVGAEHEMDEVLMLEATSRKLTSIQAEAEKLMDSSMRFTAEGRVDEAVAAAKDALALLAEAEDIAGAVGKV
jgi:hypothetical protein